MESRSFRLLNSITTITGGVVAGPLGAILGKLLGAFLTTAIPGIGDLIGSITGNLATDAIKATSGYFTHQLSRQQKKKINHDLQIAFSDACCEALYDIGGEECFPAVWKEQLRDVPAAISFPNTAAGQLLWSQKSPLAWQVADCLQAFAASVKKHEILPLDPTDEQTAANVEAYLQAETPSRLNQLFHQQVIDPILGKHRTLLLELPALEHHLQQHLLDRTLVHLGEMLKERTPAWRAFNRAVFDELRERLAEVCAAQDEILKRLDALELPTKTADSADCFAELLTAYGQMSKEITQRMEDLGLQAAAYHRETMARLEVITASTDRIESKVERVLRFLEDGHWTIDGPPSTIEFQAPEPGEPPFKGMQYYEEADAALFFGREKLTASLVGLLVDQPVLIVTGASGSGKSSLVRAGLVPALRDPSSLPAGSTRPHGTERWPVFIMTPTAHPCEALASCLTRDADSVRAAAALLDDLKAEPRSLELYARRLIKDHSTEKLLLVVDQFEELFSLCHDLAERQQFIDALFEASKRGQESLLRVVITLRADFYANCGQYPQLRDALSKWQAFIGPMDAEEMRRAIEEPARQGGWSFEPGLVDLILQDIGAKGSHGPEPGALPLLSHALLETWRHRRGRTMTLESYGESGGVRQAIAHTAESVYTGQLTAEQQNIARSIFLRLTELGEGTQDTRRRAQTRELVTGEGKTETVERVLQLLTEARLVTVNENFVEVAHEALIREWPTLHTWLEEAGKHSTATAADRSRVGMGAWQPGRRPFISRRAAGGSGGMDRSKS